MSQINRIYKDRLFRVLFGREENKDILLDLYNALNNTHYEDPSILEMTTLDDVLYMGMKNDVSFIVGSELNLFEQQSTFNPNMPLRMMNYYGTVMYGRLAVSGVSVYGKRRVMLPAPRCIVFYNGTKELPERMQLRLSEMFEGEAEGCEWTVCMLNINAGHNKEIMDKCQVLCDYSGFVDRVRHNLRTMDVRRSVEDAVKYYSAHHSRFGDILLKNRGEMMDIIFSEFDKEKFAEAMREEGLEEGIEKGIAKGRAEGIAKGMAEGREEGKAEGKVIAEQQLTALVNCLIDDGKSSLIREVFNDPQLKAEMMKKYNL